MSVRASRGTAAREVAADTPDSHHGGGGGRRSRVPRKQINITRVALFRHRRSLRASRHCPAARCGPSRPAAARRTARRVSLPLRLCVSSRAFPRTRAPRRGVRLPATSWFASVRETRGGSSPPPDAATPLGPRRPRSFPTATPHRRAPRRPRWWSARAPPARSPRCTCRDSDGASACWTKMTKTRPPKTRWCRNAVSPRFATRAWR